MNQRLGYYDSPWPCEDGGPQRLQYPEKIKGLNLQPNEKLNSIGRTAISPFLMVVLRDPGEVYTLNIQALSAKFFKRPLTCHIEKINPETLKTIKKSPKLEGGPFWAGGVGIHKNGDLYVSNGRWAHRLNPDCEPVNSYRLPENLPYNSLLFLDNGIIVTKPFSDKGRSLISFLDPETLEPVCDHVAMPEPSISRISAKGNTTYVVGTRSIFRYHWDDAGFQAILDKDWKLDYVGNSGHDYGWDPVIDDENVWFMDNGRNTMMKTILGHMVGQGTNPSPMNMVRVNLLDSSDCTIQPVTGLPYGSSTNPPFFTPDKNILVGYDSPNSMVRAWRWKKEEKSLDLLWEKTSFCPGGHMIYFRDTGELVMNDYHRFIKGDNVVILDIESGEEKGRVKGKNMAQGLAFSAPGWGRDLYYILGDKLVRVWVD